MPDDDLDTGYFSEVELPDGDLDSPQETIGEHVMPKTDGQPRLSRQQRDHQEKRNPCLNQERCDIGHQEQLGNSIRRYSKVLVTLIISCQAAKQNVIGRNEPTWL